MRRNSLADSTIQAFAGAYGNIGYMGPGLALLALGEKAAVPVALIVCFENALHFIVAPALMALEGGDKRSVWRLAGDIARKVLLHPSSCRLPWVLPWQRFRSISQSPSSGLSIIWRKRLHPVRYLPWA